LALHSCWIRYPLINVISRQMGRWYFENVKETLVSP
jgi:hypothetical protein